MQLTIPLYTLNLAIEKMIIAQNMLDDEDSAVVIANLISMSAVEKNVLLLLDSKNNLIGAQIIGIGGVNSVDVCIPEIFRTALLAGARGIIVGHNHPSGDPTPSDPDWNAAITIADVARKLGINFIDSIIVSPSGRHESLRERITYDHRHRQLVW
ncbi:RadC DNA repair proteins [uncultured Caudovirales phage]|uniref:RadC DNA repair proteins n=1 Tax=uncultured Caudovirales phage TaxID=2100421 RepID=A0A6J5RWQ2_9CAUD|nr:RadC DNA repair proteins [uncultured Caudovirales phage]